MGGNNILKIKDFFSILHLFFKNNNFLKKGESKGKKKYRKIKFSPIYKIFIYIYIL